jgi:hypothetical protein
MSRLPYPAAVFGFAFDLAVRLIEIAGRAG